MFFVLSELVFDVSKLTQSLNRLKVILLILILSSILTIQTGYMDSSQSSILEVFVVLFQTIPNGKTKKLQLRGQNTLRALCVCFPCWQRVVEGCIPKDGLEEYVYDILYIIYDIYIYLYDIYIYIYLFICIIVIYFLQIEESNIYIYIYIDPSNFQIQSFTCITSS